MTQFLPPNLLALFAPRDPIKYLPPTERLPFEKKTTGYSGVSQYISLFEDPKDTPAPKVVESREERLERKKREKAEQAAYKLEQGIALWDPMNNSSATSDPYKTLFVGRINYDTSESKLRREFEAYGPVKKVHMVHDKVTGKPRGYAFIEFEHERDMHSAYKHADGKKIDGRRIVVDVERGRTVKGWLPRRLGGGLGHSRRGPQNDSHHEGKGGVLDDLSSRYSGRENRRPDSRESDRDHRSYRSRSPRSRGSRSDRRGRSRSRDRAVHSTDRIRGSDRNNDHRRRDRRE